MSALSIVVLLVIIGIILIVVVMAIAGRAYTQILNNDADQDHPEQNPKS